MMTTFHDDADGDKVAEEVVETAELDKAVEQIQNMLCMKRR
jgi:hypothetical protein